MSKLTIQPASLHQKNTIAKLMQLYMHDLSSFQEIELLPDGRFDVSPYFDAYWDDSDRHPFLIWENKNLGGFALVRTIDQHVFSMAEFFIVRSFRGTGLAKRAATALFDYFRGEWRVAQIEGNVPAHRFWERVISEYTGGAFEDRRSDSQPSGPMQVFRSDGCDSSADSFRQPDGY